MSGIHGILLMSTGGLHILFGLLPMIYGKDWYAYLRSGFFNTISIKGDRSMAAFWFVIGGPVMFIAGLAIYEMEIRIGVLPQSIGWALLLVAITGTTMLPKSGFTALVLPQAIFYLIKSMGVL